MTLLLESRNAEAGPLAAPSPALRTDRYELTMLEAALRDGTAGRRAVFEAFARKLPPSARYGLVFGSDRLVDAICSFRFGPGELAFLEQGRVVSPACLEWLAGYRFSGDVDAYPDGEAWFPGSPLVTVRSSFAEAVLLETVILSILNHGCAIATEAARMREAAGAAQLIEMGSRRIHEAAAVDAAAAAFVAGFESTSNLEAGARYGVPTAGTAAHAWTLAHTSELEAFAAQIEVQGLATTLLVDTYSIRSGIEAALTAAQAAGAAGPGAIRIDSGDLAAETTAARAQLDGAGATATRIVVSGDLDADSMLELRRSGAPIDAFGIGTNLVASRPIGAVYKLVAIEDGAGCWRDVAKTAPGKISIGGPKSAWRRLEDGHAIEEVISIGGGAPASEAGRPVGERVISGGVDVRLPIDLPGRVLLARARAQRAATELSGAPVTVRYVRWGASTQEDPGAAPAALGAKAAGQPANA